MTDTPKPLTADEIADLKAKAKAATPGPWEADGQGNRINGGYGPYEDAAVLFRRNGHMTTGVLLETSNADHLLTPEERRANCEHIAAANPETILRLIDMVERQREQIEKLRNTLAEAQDVIAGFQPRTVGFHNQVKEALAATGPEDG